MSDIVERLKQQHHNTNVLDGDLMREAAAEILRLRAEVATLREQAILSSTAMNKMQEDCEKLRERLYSKHECFKAQTEHLNLLKSDKGFLQEQRKNLVAENEKLRAALKPLAELEPIVDTYGETLGVKLAAKDITEESIRAAATALKETERHND